MNDTTNIYFLIGLLLIILIFIQLRKTHQQLEKSLETEKAREDEAKKLPISESFSPGPGLSPGQSQELPSPKPIPPPGPSDSSPPLQTDVVKPLDQSEKL